MGDPLLSGALTVAPRLVRIDLPHSLQEVFRVRLGNVGRFGPAAAVAIFGTPRCGAGRFLRPFRHMGKLRAALEKASVRDADACHRAMKVRAFFAMIRTAALIGALLFPPIAAIAEDAQALQEIRELKQLIEQQMKRIDELTVEVGRLHQAVEARKAALAPGPEPKHEVGTLPPFSGYTTTLTPAPVKGDVPKAERAKPEPAAAPDEPKAEASSAVKHLVEKGETLTAIAKRYNVGLPDLQKANKGVNDRKLQIGQTLTIPIAKLPETPAAEIPITEKKENP